LIWSKTPIRTDLLKVRSDAPQVELTQANLNRNRDFRVLNDYRGIMGGLFQRMYGLNAARIDAVFPGARPTDVGLI
jgi:hypothetical protein